MKKTCSICKSELDMGITRIVQVKGRDWICRECLKKANIPVMSASGKTASEISALVPLQSENDNKYCSNCGSQLNGAKFCPQCGAAISAANEIKSNQISTPIASNYDVNATQKNKSIGKSIKKGLVISAIVLNLLLITIVTLALLLPNNEQSGAGTESNQSNIDTIEIPDVVGMDYETAKEKLKNIDVEITVDYTYSNTLKTNCNTPQDIVVTQSLQGKVEKGNKMIIVVAKPAISINQINLDTNYVGGIDTTIDFTNNSDKQIAYIYFNVKYYDRMGYSASCSIEHSPNARLKLTGPVDASQTDDGFWEAVIYNSSVAAIQPQTIEIIFTDGTSQTIQNNGVYWYTSSYYGGILHN